MVSRRLETSFGGLGLGSCSLKTSVKLPINYRFAVNLAAELVSLGNVFIQKASVIPPPIIDSTICVLHGRASYSKLVVDQPKFSV